MVVYEVIVWKNFYITGMRLIKQKNNQGFTLMETVVGLALFGVALIALTDIYLLSQVAQNRLVGETKIQSDARYVMEVMAREIRMNMIDYEAISGSSEQSSSEQSFLNYLPLRDLADNTLVFFTTSSPTICEGGTTNCLAVMRNNSDSASITPSGVNILRANFYVYPESDPFKILADDYAASSTPRVTIILVTENVNGRLGEKNTQHLQTTVSSRIYKRY